MRPISHAFYALFFGLVIVYYSEVFWFGSDVQIT